MENMTYVWISLAVFVGVLTLFLIYLVIFKIRQDRKGKIKANFIYDDRSIELKNYFGIVDKLIYDEIEYEYDDNLTIRKKGVKNIFYVVGNKNPIDFQNPKDNAMTYADYKKIIKSKILNDLLEDEVIGLTKFEKMLMFVVGVSALVTLGFIWYYSQQPAPVELNLALKEFIKEAVTEVIRG